MRDIKSSVLLDGATEAMSFRKSAQAAMSRKRQRRLQRRGTEGSTGFQCRATVQAEEERVGTCLETRTSKEYLEKYSRCAWWPGWSG